MTEDAESALETSSTSLRSSIPPPAATTTPSDPCSTRNCVVSVCDMKPQGDIPNARVASQLVTVGTRLYLHGGADEKTSYGDLHVLEIEKLTWKTVKVGGFSKPSPRYGHSMTLDESGKTIVLFGGLVQAECELKLNETVPSSFPPPYFMASSTATKGRLRPWSHHGNPSNEIFMFDVQALTWSVSAEEEDSTSATVAIKPRSFHAACIIEQSLLVFGGAPESNLEENTLNDLWSFSLEKQTWRQLNQKGGVPSPRRGHAMVCLPKHRQLFLFGGAEDDGALFSANLDDKLLTADWSRVEVQRTAPLARSFHSMSVIADKIYIFAGQTISEIADLYIFDYERKTWRRPLYEGRMNIKAHSCSVLHDKLIVFGGARERTDTAKAKNEAAGGGADEDGGIVAPSGLRVSRKLLFANVLELKEGGRAEGNFKFKMVTVGDSGVGKSCLLTRFVQDVYSDFHVATLGLDFKTVVAMVKGKLVRLQLWDTAGQERFSVVTGNYYRNADAFVIVYDATNRESFKNVNSWMKQIKQHHECGSSTVTLLVGNKYDLVENVVVSEEEGQAQADSLGAIFVNTSAKTASNVDNAFLSAAARLVESRRRALDQVKSLQLNRGSGGAGNASSLGSNTIRMQAGDGQPNAARSSGSSCCSGGSSSTASSASRR